MSVRRNVVRKVVILGVGSVVIAGAFMHRSSLRPLPAPVHVQESGYELVRDEVGRLLESGFGRSSRGRMLLEEILRMLDEEMIVFSSRLDGPRGLSWSELLGRRIVYVKVLEMNNDNYIHQLPWQLAEVLCHEALHSLKGGVEHSSLEEECDAFAAGVCAQAASRGEEEEDVLTMDGVVIGEFVLRSYSKAARDHDYEPLGWTREELSRRCRLPLDL